METIACKALVAFTQFVPEYGQVHGDPDSSDKEARNPKVPTDFVKKFADSGFVALPKNFKADEAEAEAEVEADAAEADATPDAEQAPA